MHENIKWNCDVNYVNSEIIKTIFKFKQLSTLVLIYNLRVDCGSTIAGTMKFYFVVATATPLSK